MACQTSRIVSSSQDGSLRTVFCIRQKSRSFFPIRNTATDSHKKSSVCQTVILRSPPATGCIMISRMKGTILSTGMVLEKGNSIGKSARSITAIQHAARQRPPRFLRQSLQFKSGSRTIRRTESDTFMVNTVIKEMLKQDHPFSVLCIPVQMSPDHSEERRSLPDY